MVFNPVSVIIPPYNRSGLLSRAIDSVLAKTMLDYEILVIDDGSTDDTADLVQHYANPSIRYIRNPTNLGAGRSWNIGICHSNGNTIAFLDSDDAWFPTKLEEQLRYISDSIVKKQWISYTPVLVKGTSPEYSIPDRGLLPDEHLSEYLVANGGIILTSTIMLSKNIALNFLFSPELKLHTDADLCLRLYSQNAQFLYCPIPLTL